MKKTEKGMTVRILEKEYQIACKEGEREDLLKATRYLEGKLKEVGAQGKIIGSERAAIMAALNISYEWIQSQNNINQYDSFEQRLETMQQEVRSVVDKYRQASI